MPKPPRGVRQPLEEIGAYCKKVNTVLVVDAVTSLGACSVKVDEWGIDGCLRTACPQKGLSVPGTFANYSEPQGDGDPSISQVKGSEFLSRFDFTRKILGRREGLSPYGTCVHVLCFERGAEDRF